MFVSNIAPVPSQLISFSTLTAQDHSYLVNGNATYTQWIALACIILHPWLNYCLLVVIKQLSAVTLSSE